MPRIKSSAKIAKKWETVTPGRSGDYSEGVKDPGVDWAGAAAASEESYNAGVQTAIAEKRFAAGVARAGNEKWKDKAVKLGVGRWGPGVQAAVVDYEKGFAPFRDAIEATELPPRAPRGDPRNEERQRTMARVLHEARVRR